MLSLPFSLWLRTSLVYDGPTRTGKSIRACSLYGRACTLVVDCQSASVPDLKELSYTDHEALVLDEISGVRFVIDNKNFLQSHIDGAKLGQSATQMYAYDVWWWRSFRFVALPFVLLTVPSLA